MQLINPPQPRPGDRVAIVSPATRKMGSTPRERADDLHAAFADPAIKAVIATIGGDAQITVLPHLDEDLIRATPGRSSGTATTPTC